MPRRGGRLIVVDPRMTPITRNADLYLPVRPGTDLALLHRACCTSSCATGWRTATFIAAHTTGFEAVGGVGAGVGPATRGAS